jgi:antitoxin component YwqK of YwqJK toxin-antitoxin module
MIYFHYKTYIKMNNYTGLYTKHNNDGILIKSYNYVNGKKEGICVDFHKYLHGWNRKVHTYKNDKKDGLFTSYNNDDSISETGEYKNNKLHGFYRVYEQNVLVLDMNYKNGKEHGNYKEFNLDGTIKEERNYHNGNQI